MTDPLFVFFGAESEYVLHPLATEMAARGHACVELHAEPDRSIKADFSAAIADPRPKALITSSHFCWDERYMWDQMEVPDCPALMEVFAALDPVLTVYSPHDLSQPMLTSEAAALPLVDLYLAATPTERAFSHRTEVVSVGWIKTPADLDIQPERWGRGLWLTMSLEYILVEEGLERTLDFMSEWIESGVWIKFPPFPQFAAVEKILKEEHGVNIVDRHMSPGAAARHFDFVATNGESSVVRESAAMGVPVYIVTDIGFFGDTSRRNLWQFVDLDNVHVIRTLDDVPSEISHTPPTMRPFDMDAAIAAIERSWQRKCS